MDLAMPVLGSEQNLQHSRQEQLYIHDSVGNSQGIPPEINPENYYDPNHPQLIDQFIAQLVNRHTDQQVREEAQKYLDVKTEIKRTIKIEELEIYEEILKAGKEEIKQLNSKNQQTQGKISDLRDQIFEIRSEVQGYQETIQQVLIPHLKLKISEKEFESIQDITQKQKILLEEDTNKFDAISRKIQQLGQETKKSHNSECNQIVSVFQNLNRCRKELHQLYQNQKEMEMNLSLFYSSNSKKQGENAQTRERICHQEKKIAQNKEREGQIYSQNQFENRQFQEAEKICLERNKKNAYFSFEYQNLNLFYNSFLIAWALVLILASVIRIV